MTEVHRARYGTHNPDETYVAHTIDEQLVDVGEVELNYATLGDPSSPALLLVPGQTESWWGYEAVMPLLAEHFQVFAVDLRGQGRSTRTPGRYTLDNMGNDLVRFMDVVIGRPTLVSGLSSGGVLSAWLSAYAEPGQVVASVYEDPPLFASEVRPAIAPGIRQGIGPLFHLWSTFLGDQWSIGAWDAMREGAVDFLPDHLKGFPVPEEPGQALKEYDPEWGRAFWTGSVAASCDHDRMLRSVKVPSVLLTHHLRSVDEGNGFLFGAMTDQQADRVRELLTAAGVAVTYRSFPDVGHSMHGDRPELYVETLLDWVEGLERVIDVHAHHVPAFYREALLEHGHAQPDGFPQIPEWRADEHVAAMDRLGIATSLLSISSPGVHLADGAGTRDLTRAVNEEGRRAVVDRPGRFGLLASLPLPDVDAAMAEIEHCCDHLDVDGFALLTNVGGTYLGDPAFSPVFDELDRRHARVFIHPTSPPCWEQTSLGRPRPMIEFLFDTTRAVVDLVLNGTVARHPGIEWIIPHAGATLPMIADRVSVFSLLLEVDPSVDVLADLGRLHFDLAGFPIPRQLDALLTLTTIEHLHYGSDYPFTPEFAVEAGRERLAEVGDPPGSLLEALQANSRRLFPELVDPR